MAYPPAKKPKVEGPAAGKRRCLWRPTSEVVLRQSRAIHDYLNVHELRKHMMNPSLNFLSQKESRTLQEQVCEKPSEFLASLVLGFLNNREGPTREEDFRKFVACINKADEHSGHCELSDILRSKVNKEEWIAIESLEREAESPYNTPQNSPAPPPEKPVPLITLQGQLAEERFLDLERELWLSFSKGDYINLEQLLEGMEEKCAPYDADCKVVNMWFKSLVLMHRHARYKDAISSLDDALELTGECVNRPVLKGRICQRQAQIFLMMGNKVKGALYFKMAREELQFVGRGYDKTNMYCREAKLLSATEPDKREDIEKVYEHALGSLEQDDPYFLASYPSVILSKTAFHLHFAFGSKPPDTRLPSVGCEDIQKAREALAGFNEEEHILIDMRRQEYNAIQAELCRLEGREEEARSRFSALVRATGQKKTGNISAIAEHRLKAMSHHLQDTNVH